MNHHNCQTILQPPLKPVSACILPERNARDESAERYHARVSLVCAMLEKTPEMSQTKISKQLKITDSTASRLLEKMMAEGKIERVDKGTFVRSPRKFYKLKEYLQ